MNRLNEITFGLENCESITVQGKYVGEFRATDFRKEIARVAMNAICEQEVCEKFFLELHRDADKEYAPFGIDDSKTTVFRRLTEFGDITSIQFTLTDDDVYYECKVASDENTKECDYLLVYDSEYDSLGANNRNQKSFLSDNGWLYIVVSKGKEEVRDIFDMNEINSADYAKFVEDMYDIGDKGWENAKKFHEECLMSNGEDY